MHSAEHTTTTSGHGFSLIDNLPVELHLPGYNFCGPGTKLAKRLARGDKGVNLLDEACLQHDIQYSATKDQSARHAADIVLAERAKEIRKRKDVGFGQKLAAFAVDKIMRAKVKMGAGCVRSVTKHLLRKIKAATTSKKKKKKNNKKKPATRVLPIPTAKGGFLPFLIPALAGLSAVGSLAGGAAAIARTVKNAENAKKELEEAKRHNRVIEAISIGKGLYLKPYRQGLGLFINKKKNI